MIDPGDSGIDRELLAGFLESLAELECLGFFPSRFTLEVRTLTGSAFFHVDGRRGVVRPVVAEDSRKKLVSVTLPRFRRLVKHGGPDEWCRAIRSGDVRAD